MKRFWSDQCGSAAIDWVALAAGILLLGLMTVYSVFRVGVSDIASEIDEAMRAADCSSGVPIDPDVEGSDSTGNKACNVPGTPPNFNE